MDKFKKALVISFILIIGLCPAIFAKGDADISILVEGNNTFALKLYNRLKIQDGNIFFSPYSISTALAMTYAGARGNTEKQLAETLCFPFNQNQFHPVFANYELKLMFLLADNNIEISTANAIWVQKNHVFLKEFLDITRGYYDAEPVSVDFKNNSEIVRLQINNWVEEQTNDKINDLIQPGIIDFSTELVLTNAVYFKADWLEKFENNLTKDAPFKLLSEKSIMVKMMMAEKGRYRYGENSNLQILEMPYKGNNVSIIILLPKKDDGLIEAEKLLNINNIQEWIGSLNKKEVKVFLPSFKISSGFDLSAALAAMGMSDAFGSLADFSGMDGTKNLFISRVIHKAYIDVNEEGTEAAAATAVIMKKGLESPLPVFNADHPFIFLIRENLSGSILFLGRVTDPNIFLGD